MPKAAELRLAASVTDFPTTPTWEVVRGLYRVFVGLQGWWTKWKASLLPSRLWRQWEVQTWQSSPKKDVIGWGGGLVRSTWNFGPGDLNRGEKETSAFFFPLLVPSLPLGCKHVWATVLTALGVRASRQNPCMSGSGPGLPEWEAAEW